MFYAILIVMKMTFGEYKSTHKNKLLPRFTEGTRVLLLMLRKKDGGHTKERRRRLRTKIVTSGSDEFFAQLKKLKQEWQPGLRIYSSVNPRSMKKGIHILKQKMLEADFAGGEQQIHFYTHLKENMVSALCKPESRERSDFLIDIDGDDKDKKEKQVLAILKENDIKIHTTYETKNGLHIITDPFNPNLIPSEMAEVKKDTIMLLYY